MDSCRCNLLPGPGGSASAPHSLGRFGRISRRRPPPASHRATMATVPVSEAPKEVMDPLLLPSIVPRVRRIAQLLQESQHADAAEQEPSQVDPPDMDDVEPSNEGLDTMSSSLALGAIADDEDMDVWTQRASTNHMSRVPPALLAQLAQETNLLRATFTHAQQAIDAAPGGDMSLAEQERLLEQLEAYASQQEYVGTLTQSGAYRLVRGRGAHGRRRRDAVVYVCPTIPPVHAQASAVLAGAWAHRS